VIWERMNKEKDNNKIEESVRDLSEEQKQRIVSFFSLLNEINRKNRDSIFKDADDR
jgi:hypothetical protein